jgi:outer membrane protein, multidrug efflux system
VYASEQGRRGVILSVVSSVAASYITLRALDRAARDLAGHGGELQGDAGHFRIAPPQGVVSRLEVAQIESQYQQALAVIPVLEGQIAAQEHLLVDPARDVTRADPPRARARRVVVPAVPAALPAALLEQRPDIVQAEQDLVAANAEIGAARALYFPDLTLTGTLGQLSTAAGDLLESAARPGRSMLRWPDRSSPAAASPAGGFCGGGARRGIARLPVYDSQCVARGRTTRWPRPAPAPATTRP